jgi:hypothetical protein
LVPKTIGGLADVAARSPESICIASSHFVGKLCIAIRSDCRWQARTRVEHGASRFGRAAHRIKHPHGEYVRRAYPCSRAITRLAPAGREADREKDMTEAIAVVFLVLFWAVAIYAISRTRWRPLGWILIIIAVDRLVFYARWLRYSRRYDRIHNFIDLANRYRRKPVSGLVIDQSTKPKSEVV